MPVKGDSVLLAPNVIFSEYAAHRDKRRIAACHFAGHRNGSGFIPISTTNPLFRMPSPRGSVGLWNGRKNWRESPYILKRYVDITMCVLTFTAFSFKVALYIYLPSGKGWS
jgi:hypothetical protein